MIEFILSVDKTIIEIIHKYIQNPLLDKIIPFITSLGNMGLIWIFICIVFLLSKNYKKAGILAIYSLIITTVLGELFLKNLIARPRPFMEILNIDLLINKPSSYSFPSGHTGSSFAAAFAFIKMIDNGKIVIPLVFLACIIAFSRLYLMVHYPTDIIAGIILGLISATLASKYFNFKEKNKSTSLNR